MSQSAIRDPQSAIAKLPADPAVDEALRLTATMVAMQTDKLSLAQAVAFHQRLTLLCGARLQVLTAAQGRDGSPSRPQQPTPEVA